jgi:hypothetical protein
MGVWPQVAPMPCHVSCSTCSGMTDMLRTNLRRRRQARGSQDTPRMTRPKQRPTDRLPARPTRPSVLAQPAPSHLPGPPARDSRPLSALQSADTVGQGPYQGLSWPCPTPPIVFLSNTPSHMLGWVPKSAIRPNSVHESAIAPTQLAHQALLVSEQRVRSLLFWQMHVCVNVRHNIK